eukprot:TRINITY_DN10827_c0_g1_i1.p1 TRINITY_DN10827_c0_g1~~TRINITY_DN10827_c0_g1_i1.p1  ORF type:complete len:448 (+),score=106.17 TRINITY_DN10827_c0_g1_i1:944-2287(+)
MNTDLAGIETLGYVFGLSVVGGLNQGGDSRLYVGGSFRCRVSGTVRTENICGYNEGTNSWFELGTTGLGANLAVFAVAALYDSGTSSDVVFIGGQFTNIDGVYAQSIAVWTAVTNSWRVLGNKREGGASLTVNSIAIAFPCSLQALPPITPTTTPSVNSVFCNGQTCDDGDACTVDICSDNGCVHIPKVCNDGDICTTDTCNAVTGQCMFQEISDCAPALRQCSDFTDCGSCAEDSECGWLQCVPDSASGGNGFGNFTTFALSNHSNEVDYLFYTTSNVSLVLEDPETGKQTKLPSFKLGGLQVYIASDEDLKSASGFGVSRATSGQCIPKDFSNRIIGENEDAGLTCDVIFQGDEDQCGFLFQEPDQLTAQASKIGTSVAVAGGASGGSCGFFVIGLIFYRRKKKVSEFSGAKLKSTKMQTKVDLGRDNLTYNETATDNVLYQEAV